MRMRIRLCELQSLIMVQIFFITGKGSFGEIFLASKDTRRAVTPENAKFVAKIEPHSNGPLFVEIHCLLNTGKRTGKYKCLLHEFGN